MFCVVALVAVLQSVASVDRDVFKTCDDVKFCRRNRIMASLRETNVTYFVPQWSVSNLSEGVSFRIQSVLESEPFLEAEVFLLSNGVLSILIDEISPLRKRYRVDTDEEYNYKQLKMEPSFEIRDTEIIWVHRARRFVINFSPFQVSGYYNNKLVYVINQRNLMNFERFRPQDECLMHNEWEMVDFTALIEDYNNSETFLSWKDENQFGPSSVGIDITFEDAKHVYGIPEHADSLSLGDTSNSDPYRLYNLDVFKYEANEKMALYGSVPFMLSTQGGFFWNNPSETWIDISTKHQAKQAHWFSETGVMHMFLFLESTPMKITQKFTILTGHPLFPPLSALGYHQSRWNYNNQSEVLNLRVQFDKNQIPVDMIWLDIEHTDKKHYFTWDPTRFSEPLDMVKSLEKHGRKLVTIVDPHLHKDHRNRVFKYISQNHLGVNTSDGATFSGRCWPGTSIWPDFFNPQTREYWATQFQVYNYKGTTNNVMIWNDMNEPSVFSGPEMTMPKSNIHYNGFEHREVHNLYGYMNQKATFTGLIFRDQNIRPFLLSRSFFAGSQKFGAVWTGDNESSPKHLYLSIPMCLSIAITGNSFCGADVGGFFGNPDPLLVERWYQLGAFLPFFRAHSHIETERREPWLYEKKTAKVIRDAIVGRYRILPYLYTLFYENSALGTPVIRPMFMQYPGDAEAEDIERQFHLGDAILIRSPVETDEREEVYLPEGRWFDFYTYQEEKESKPIVQAVRERIPVYLRGGCVVPVNEQPRRSTEFMKKGPWTLVVVLDQEKQAKGRMYVDDFMSFDYTKGNYLISEFKFAENRLEYTVMHQWGSMTHIEKAVVLGLGKCPNQVEWHGVESRKNLKFQWLDSVLTIFLDGISADENWRITFN